jgi:hypothetical protein
MVMLSLSTCVCVCVCVSMEKSLCMFLPSDFGTRQPIFAKLGMNFMNFSLIHVNFLQPVLIMCLTYELVKWEAQ